MIGFLVWFVLTIISARAWSGEILHTANKGVPYKVQEKGWNSRSFGIVYCGLINVGRYSVAGTSRSAVNLYWATTDKLIYVDYEQLEVVHVTDWCIQFKIRSGNYE